MKRFCFVIITTFTLTTTALARTSSPNDADEDPQGQVPMAASTETAAVAICNDCQTNGNLDVSLDDCTTQKCPQHLQGASTGGRVDGNEDTK